MILVFVIVLLGCQRNYTPKSRGYFRIEFPEKTYQRLDSIYPYSFDYPAYAKIEPAINKHSEAYWANVVFPTLNGTIYLSYKPLHNNLAEIIEDSRKMAYKHTIKADAINEQYFANEKDQVYGTLYEIKGDAASSIQFTLTDSSSHFLRGSLYFNAVPNKDSLAPVINFVKKDVIHLMESLKWK
ncbi:gliding motility lipoprotein GldD [Marinilabiliaceae bacterium JC017]|nr:gliding motility lipoprotein GldD [Marinilabiliaceae bacterium JC017]